MGWINLSDPAPPGFFDGVRDTDPYYISPEQERALEAADECQHCDHGRVLVFRCEGVCTCGFCPDIGDCPECCGHDDPMTEPTIQHTQPQREPISLSEINERYQLDCNNGMNDDVS